jgi:hypothetical protein
MGGRLDPPDIDLLELGDMGKDVRELRGKAGLFLPGELDSGEVRHLVDVEFLG